MASWLKRLHKAVVKLNYFVACNARFFEFEGRFCTEIGLVSKKLGSFEILLVGVVIESGTATEVQLGMF